MKATQSFFSDPSESLAIEIANAKMYHYPRAWGITPHVFRSNYLLYFLRGKGWIEFQGGERLEAGQGDLFILKTGHSYAAAGDPESLTTVYNATFMVRGSGECDILRPMPLPFRVRLNLDERRLIEGAFARMVLEYSGFDEHSLMRRLAARGALLQLLAEILRVCAAAPASAKSAGPAPLPDKDSELAVVLSHIDNHLARPLTVAALADLVHLSPNHFSASFRKKIGKPPMDYVRQRRIAAAREQLLRTDKSIKQIAGEVGYPDRFHFSRVFRSVTGLPPNSFRESYKYPFAP